MSECLLKVYIITCADEDNAPYSYLCHCHWPPAETRVVHIKVSVIQLDDCGNETR